MQDNFNPIRDVEPISPIFIEISNDKQWALNKLMTELEIGRKSGEENGYISEEEVDREFGLI
ncbi:MAG: hypothetical protein FWG90_13225 [Oscillospiraceae bacterium]|nr:hypothetical protein [Oscillospiraceae bacterium]